MKSFCVKSSSFLCIALLVLSTIRPAHADPFGDWLKRTFGGGSETQSARSSLRPKIIPEARNRTSVLNQKRFYLVKLVCTKVDDYANKLISQGLVVDNQTFVANTLWFSGSSGDGGVPANPVKIANAFSFEKEANGTIKDFDDQTCSDTFLMSGANDVLTVSLSYTDTNSMSGFSKIFSSALKITTGIVPLFLGGPLAATITTAAKALGDTADPVKSIVEAFNRSPQKAVTAIKLRTGKTVVKTDYNQVTMTITPIIDITAQIATSDNLKANFGKIFKAISETQLAGIAASVARDRCAKFYFQLRDEYSFSRKDQLYLLGYFALKGFPGDVSSRLQCLLNRDLSVAFLNYGFPFNADGTPPITQADIDNVYSPANLIGGGARLNGSVAQAYLERLSNLLPKYAQAAPEAQENSKRALLTWIGADTIALEDPTTDFADTLSSSVNADALIAKLGQQWKRYGCFILYPSTSNDAYDGIMLALPIKPAAGDTFEVSELLGMRLLLAGTGKIDPPAKVQKIGFTKSGPPILEAAKAFNGVCYSAKIKTN